MMEKNDDIAASSASTQPGIVPGHSRWWAFACFLFVWALCSLCLVKQYQEEKREVPSAFSENALVRDVYVHHEFPYRDAQGNISVFHWGTRLAQGGEKLDDEQRRLVNSYLEYDHDKFQALIRFKHQRILQAILLLGGLLLCFTVCLYRIRPEYFRRPHRVILSLVFILLHFALMSLSYDLWTRWYGASVLHLLALFPLCVVPGLATFLLGERVSLCLTLLLTSLSALLCDGEFQYILFQYSLIYSLIGIMVYRKVTLYRQLFYGFFEMTLAAILLTCFVIWHRGMSWAWEDLGVFCSELAHNDFWKTHAWTSILTLHVPPFWLGILETALLNGIVTTVLMFLLPKILERYFDVVSPITLHGLARLDHPLLARMRKEAPGTYNHCMEVGRLAAEAAEAIGGNADLAKVCGSFHDIGKLVDPQSFAENNLGKESPHASLTPYESSNRIREHVTQGRDMAQRWHLLKPVIEAIQTHHGNDMVFFFYRKACLDAQKKGLEPPQTKDFRYEAPLPRRREAVLVEIADICEAASRAEFSNLDMIDEEVVKKFVNKLVMGKMQNRQFADSEMTMAEFTTVCDTLCRCLLGKYHRRPKYSEVENEDGKATQNVTPPQNATPPQNMAPVQNMPAANPQEAQTTKTVQPAVDSPAQITDKPATPEKPASPVVSQGAIDIQEPSVKDGEWKQDGV